MLEKLKEEVAGAGRALGAAGLVTGSAGNVSAREDGLVAISPTGAALGELSAEQVAVVELDGTQVDGELAPTSELDLHLCVHRAFETGAVIHTHAPAATALACVLDELPVIHYEMLLLGGSIRVAPYATFGSAELAESVRAALEGRTAALLANHGTVCHGPDLAAALRATELLEWMADLYRRASAIGEPRALSAEEQRAVVEAAVARSYGSTKPAGGNGGGTEAANG